MKELNLFQVGEGKVINLSNITSVQDYGKRIEIGMSGSANVEVAGDVWLASVREALITPYIGKNTLHMVEDVQEAEFIEVPTTVSGAIYLETEVSIEERSSADPITIVNMAKS